MPTYRNSDTGEYTYIDDSLIGQYVIPADMPKLPPPRLSTERKHEALDEFGRPMTPKLMDTVKGREFDLVARLNSQLRSEANLLLVDQARNASEALTKSSLTIVIRTLEQAQQEIQFAQRKGMSDEEYARLMRMTKIYLYRIQALLDGANYAMLSNIERATY